MMVIGLLTVAAIPTTIGVCEAVSAQKKQNAKEKEKVRFSVTADLSIDGGPAFECWVVLAEGKLFIDHPDAPAPGHKFSGYYFPYPSEAGHLGMVSTIADDPPMLNWIFVDKDTGMVRHGGRKDTTDHLIGPWGWTDDEKWLTLEGEPTGFVAVEDAENKKWNVYYDRDRGDDSRLLLASDPDVDPYDDSLVWVGEDDIERRAVPIKLRRKTALGMDSRFVRDSQR